MISIAITTYNRSGFTIESFINVLNNDYIDDIVIIDDNSDPIVYNNLAAIIQAVNNSKIKLYRNDTNLSPFRNKREAVEKCTNDWVILFDSDNVIDNDYVDIVARMKKNEKIMYSPEALYDVFRTNKQWTYENFKGVSYGKENVNNYIEDVMFQTMLNTGNNFFHRQTFLKAMALVDEPISDIGAGDCMYSSYLWLLNGGRIRVVDNLGYIHRMHDKSYYMNNMNQGVDFNYKTRQKIKVLCRIGVL